MFEMLQEAHQKARVIGNNHKKHGKNSGTLKLIDTSMEHIILNRKVIGCFKIPESEYIISMRTYLQQSSQLRWKVNSMTRMMF